MDDKTKIGWMCVVALTGGCILEDNPAFVDGAGTVGGTAGAVTSGDIDPTEADSTGTGSDGGGTPEAGCDDPSVCPTYHVGPVAASCPHEIDGVATTSCDFFGRYGLRVAVATIDFTEQSAQVVLHDNGVRSTYVGGIDVPGDTTIRTAEGVPSGSVTVVSQDGPGVLRLRGDGVHLAGFAVMCEVESEWAITVRSDLETEGTETSGHLIENLEIISIRPQDVRNNAIEQWFQSIGAETVIRNNHIWGYFEGTLDMRFATDSLFSHNTLVYYQPLFAEAVIDARDVDGLQISNNVVLSLSQPVDALISANAGTAGLRVIGNAVEGATAIMGGNGSADVDDIDNTIGALELGSPRDPRVLADSSLRASSLGTSEGTSVDGIPLSSAETTLPGAYQSRSALSLPRRTRITVGEGQCGGDPCDVTKGIDNELQYAAWSTWPGGSIDIAPSLTPYAGPMIISWPMNVGGAGSSPEEVVVRRERENERWGEHGLWSGKDVVIDVLGSMSAATLVEMLTIEAGPNEIGIFHEGLGEATIKGQHGMRRLVLRDAGNITGDPADIAVYLGHDVVAHDILVHGGYDTCVRFGPRPWESSPTPTTAAFIYNITCRLTEPVPERDVARTGPMAAFELAAVDGAVIANAVVELAQDGPVFRAQRRSSEENRPTTQDAPVAFIANSITVIGHSGLYDGFEANPEVHQLIDVTSVEDQVPLFISATDSHLTEESGGIDGGVYPSELNPPLPVGVSVDGISRNERIVDRGCYEEGM